MCDQLGGVSCKVSEMNRMSMVGKVSGVNVVIKVYG